MCGPGAGDTSVAMTPAGPPAELFSSHLLLSVLLLLSEHNIRELLSRRNTQQVGLHEGQKEEEEEEQQLQSSE